MEIPMLIFHLSNLLGKDDFIMKPWKIGTFKSWARWREHVATIFHQGFRNVTHLYKLQLYYCYIFIQKLSKMHWCTNKI